MKNVFLRIAMLWSFVVLPLTAVADNDAQEQQAILSTLDKFFSAWNQKDRTSMQELVHPQLGFYYIRATYGIDIEHRSQIDFKQEPFSWWQADKVTFQPVKQYRQNNLVFMNILPVFDCKPGVYYLNQTNYCTKKDALEQGIFISKPGQHQTLSNYLEVYSNHLLTTPDGETVKLNLQEIDRSSSYYPEMSFFDEGDNVLDSGIVSKLDEFKKLESNSILIIIIGSDLSTQIEMIKEHGQWYIFVLNRFYSYCSMQAIFDAVDFYQCKSC